MEYAFIAISPKPTMTWIISICYGLTSGSKNLFKKSLVLDKNPWNHITVQKKKQTIFKYNYCNYIRILEIWPVIVFKETIIDKQKALLKM